MSQLARGILAVLLAVLASLPALAERRVALVIGNAAYKETSPLRNTLNDAKGMAAALRRLGFAVQEEVDLDKRAMERAIQQFERALAGATVALFYYAGHAIQVGSQNHLMPTDARLGTEGDVDFEMLPLAWILRRMERETRTALVLLDACRDNPLARNLARSMGTRGGEIGQGLAEVRTGVGTLIGFSTQPGNVALDGTGSNSPYTAALLAEIEKPGRDVLTMLAAVRAAVLKETGGRQVPWEHTSLLGPVVLKGGPAAAAPEPQPPTAGSEAERAWQLVKDSESAAELEAFIRRYAGTFQGDLARIRLVELAARRAAAQRQAEAAAKAKAAAEQAAREQAARPEDVRERRQLEEAVRRGEAWAQVRLGFFHVQGLGGLAKDEHEAARLYRLAADQGNASAQVNLATFYDQGRGGLARDEREAMRLFRLAADQGNANGRVNLAQYHEHGRGGLAKDDREAARLYRLAADQGNPNGQHALGIFNRDGRGGLVRDEREAARLFRLAAGQGHAFAQAALADFYRDGLGGLTQDRGEAARLYRLAADQGLQYALDALARLPPAQR